MNSIIVYVLISLLFSQCTIGAAIVRPSDLQLPSNYTNLFARDITPHCSRDYASYGQPYPGSVACVLASYDLIKSPQIRTIPNMYPMAFVSSTQPLPEVGNGFRTPWRSKYGGDQHGCTVAIALLSEVPDRFTPEVPQTPSDDDAIVLKGSLEQAVTALLNCFGPPDGTGVGWVEVPTLMSDAKVGIFAFKPGSPIDQALPRGPDIQGMMSSNLIAAVTRE